MKNYLLFSPFSGIWPHSFPESLILEGIKSNSNFTRMTCRSLFSDYCMVMSVYGLDESSDEIIKKRICKMCIKKSDLLNNHFDFNETYLEDFLKPEDRIKVNEYLNEITPENYIEFGIENIPVGRIALYEFLLNRKKMTNHLNSKEFSDYKISLKNCLLTYFAFKNYLSQNKLDGIFVLNVLYSVNNVVGHLAKINGIKIFYMHPGSNLAHRKTRMLMAKDSGFEYYSTLKKNWNTIGTLPLYKKYYPEVTQHFSYLIKGSGVFAYSGGVSENSVELIRKKFNINDGIKTVLIVMSSYDERYAAESVRAISKVEDLIFNDQAEWIKAVSLHFKDRKDIQFIIRVHPRELPSQRDRVVSEHSKKLKDFVSNLPSNVKVNWPEDKLSVYDLIKDIDLVLTSWSGVGREISTFGVPVLAYSKELIAYPESIHTVCENKDAYFKAIDELLNLKSPDIKKIVNAFRWCAYELAYSHVEFDSSTYNRLRKYKFMNFPLRVLNRIFPKVEPGYDLLRSKKINKHQTEFISKFISSENFALRGDIQDLNMTSEEEIGLIKGELKNLREIIFPNHAGIDTKLYNNMSKLIE